MKELLIPVGSGFLVGGLHWQPLAKKNAAKTIRDAANERSQKHYVQLGDPSKTGAYFALLNEQETGAGKYYALASALCKHAKGRAAGVILKYDELYAVCCVNEGIPILDTVFNNSADAIRELKVISERLKFTPRVNYDGPKGFIYDETLEAKLLGPKKGRVSGFKDVPQSPLIYVVAFSLLFVGGYLYWDHKQKERAREEAARLQAIKDADPIPKYLRNLAASESKFALSDAHVLKMLGRLAPIPQLPKGWIFVKAICGENQENPNTCKLEFQRSHGLYADLQKQLESFKLRFEGPTNLNVAFAYADIEAEPFKLPIYEKNYEKFVSEDYGDTAQIWLTAGLAVAERNAVLWPETPGVPATFKHPMAVLRGEIKVSDIPIELFSDFMKTKPRNMHIGSFTVATTMVDKELVSKIDATTFYHVKQNTY